MIHFITVKDSWTFVYIKQVGSVNDKKLKIVAPPFCCFWAMGETGYSSFICLVVTYIIQGYSGWEWGVALCCVKCYVIQYFVLSGKSPISHSVCDLCLFINCVSVELKMLPLTEKHKNVTSSVLHKRSHQCPPLIDSLWSRYIKLMGARDLSCHIQTAV